MHDDRDGDGNVIDLPRPVGGKSSILSDLLRDVAAKPGREAAPPPEPPPERQPENETAGPTADDSDLLPNPGDDYKAHSRAANKPAASLHVIGKDGYSRGFAWGNYDGVDWLPGDTAGGGPVLVVRFAGLMPQEVVIEGRHLGLLHAYLGQNRIAWVRELPAAKGFRDAAETVITRISIRPVTRPER